MSRRRELLRIGAAGGLLSLAGCAGLGRSAGGTRRERLGASDGSDGDLFGYSVSTSNDGRLVAIGAPSDRVDGRTSGSVYIFSRSDSGWHRDAKLVVDDATRRLGKSLAMSGDGRTVVAGTDTPALHERVYVFSRDEGGWRQQAAFAPDRQEVYFGRSVAISDDGSVVLVGAPSLQSGDEGKVYRFEQGVTDWDERTVVEPLYDGYVDQFGGCLSLDGDGETAVVTAVEDVTAGPGSLVSALSWGDGEVPSWTSVDTVVPDRVTLLDDAVALSADGTRAAVNGFVDRDGVVLVFSRTRRTWRREATLPLDDVAEHFGRSVAMSGDGRTVVVGADRRNALVDGGGVAYVFDYGDSGWDRRMELALDDGTDRDSFARSVAVSHDGTRIFVGAYGEGDVDDRLGNVYVVDTARD